MPTASPARLLTTWDRTKQPQNRKSHSSIASLRTSAWSERRVYNRKLKWTKDSKNHYSKQIQNKKRQLNNRWPTSHWVISQWNLQPFSPLKSHQRLQFRIAKVHKSTSQPKTTAKPTTQPPKTSWNRFCRACLSLRKSIINQCQILQIKYNNSVLQTQSYQFWNQSKIITNQNQAYQIAQLAGRCRSTNKHQWSRSLETRRS